jgi:glycosyltransferase involved in cell wall biosynthesis
MKVIHVNTFDSVGGAAKASIRLHKSLLNSGVDSHYLTQGRSLNLPNIHSIYKNHLLRPLTSRIRTRLDSLPLLAYPQKLNTPWNVGWLNGGVSPLIKEYEGDLAHIHWVGSGLMSLEDLSKIESKIVFTLHDSWIFTGGCHVIGDCKNFQSICTKCPQLGSRSEHDLSSYGFEITE